MTSAVLLRSAGGFLVVRPPTPPVAPASITADATSSSQIDVSWPAVANATSYTLQSSTDGSTWATRTTANVTSYAHTGLSAGDTWYYRVRANNAAGSSDYIGPVSTFIPPASQIHSLHQDGQTFIWRPELNIADSTKRYALYRHTAEITAGNIGSLTAVQTFIPFNSAQVFGGKPDTTGGQAFTTATRVDASSVSSYCKLPDGTQLSRGTALAVRTCVATEQAWYALLETDTAGALTESPQSGVNSLPFLVNETALATTYPKPVLWASGAVGTLRGASNLRITGTPNLPTKVTLHASAAVGGAPGNSVSGDYWQFWGDSTMSYEDGVQTAWDVLEYATLQQFWASPRDTIWRPDWTAANPKETWWQGAGLRKPGDATFKFYPFQHRRLLAFVDWMVSHYSADPNRVVFIGQSMGAWGSTLFSLRHPEVVAAVFASMPSFRTYALGAGGWPALFPPYPFNASSNATTPLGTSASAVLMDDGTPWGGTGGWADCVSLISNTSSDLPFYAGAVGRNDGYSVWADVVAAVRALDAGKHGYSFYWDYQGHTGTNGLWHQEKEVSGAKAWAKTSELGFRLNRSYPAFSSSSINDNIGTGAVANGDLVGGMNIGFDWGTDASATNQLVTESAGGWATKVFNRFMTGTFTGVSSTMAGNSGTGPVGGPYTTMTCSVTPRRRQSFLPSIGATVNYSFTPNGAGATSGTVTVDANGLITIPNVVINSGGPTSLTLT